MGLCLRQVSTDGGATFNSITDLGLDQSDNENGQNFGNGITGTSGSPNACDTFGTPVWTPVTADLSAYAGQTIQLRFRYWTDGAAIGQGLASTTSPSLARPADGAETDPGWTYAGFSRTTGTIVTPYFNAYVAELRQYHGFDRSLELGPYQFTSERSSSTSHIRTASWSATGILPIAITMSAIILAAA